MVHDLSLSPKIDSWSLPASDATRTDVPSNLKSDALYYSPPNTLASDTEIGVEMTVNWIKCEGDKWCSFFTLQP